MKRTPVISSTVKRSVVSTCLTSALITLLSLGSPTVVPAQESQLSVDVPMTVDSEVRAPSDESDEVERTLFDLYLGDEFQGLILASYTEDWFEIEDPLDAVEQLKMLDQADELLPLFEGPVEESREISAIGKISIDIYTFRIIVQLQPKYLDSEKLNLLTRLPDPEKGFSLQQRVGVASSGNVGGNFDSSLSFQTLGSYGKIFSRLEGAIVESGDQEITSGQVGGIVDDYQVGLGLLQTTGLSFLPSVQVLGLSVDTSEELFLDQELIRGSRFEIFVPSRSRVEFFRGGRLLLVQDLDFGLQEINTSSFPQGSYDVDIVITENNGNVSRERRFYTKSGLLANRARPILSVRTGIQRDELTLKDHYIYQTGVRWRALDVMETQAGIYGNETGTNGNVGLSLLYRNIYLDTSMTASHRGDLGAEGSLSASVSQFQLTTRATRTVRLTDATKRDLLVADAMTTLDPIITDGLQDLTSSLSPASVQEILFQDREAYGGALSYRGDRIDIRFAVESNKLGFDERRYAYGPSLTIRLIDRPENNLRTNSQYLTTQQGKVLNNSLLYRHRIHSDLYLEAQASLRNEDSRDEALFLLRLQYDAKERSNRGLRATVESELRREKPNADSTINSANNALSYDLITQYAQSVGFIRDLRSSRSSETQVGINAQTSFFVSPDGALSVSYPSGHEAALIADVQSDDAKSEFDVYVDDQLYDTVRAGEASVIGAAPFRTYELSVRPASDDRLLNIDSTAQKITLFPGNVARRTFDANRVFIALGRLVDTGGTPIEYERIRGPRDYSTSEEGGLFQIEITGHETLSIDSKAHHCTLNLGVEAPPEYFIEVGDVVCSDENPKK